MASIAIRTVILYILLSFAMRMMGKRQIGELDISELVSTLLISEIVAIPIDDPEIPLLNAVIPVLLILSAEIILSTIKNKSEKMKKAIEGSPAYIIYKGRLDQTALKENRISVNELMSELRGQGVGDLSEVYYGIIEQNGSLSVIKNNGTAMAHPLIIDGEITDACKQNITKNQEWLDKELKNRGFKADEIFLMTVTDDDKVNIIKKEIQK